MNIGHKSVHKVLARKRILEKFQTDLQREALEMSVSDQDVFVIQPKGSGKYLIFKSAPISLTS